MRSKKMVILVVTVCIANAVFAVNNPNYFGAHPTGDMVSGNDLNVFYGVTSFNGTGSTGIVYSFNTD